MEKGYNAPIMSSKDVKELLEILHNNNASTKMDFIAVIDQVKAMEKQLNIAINTLTAISRELADAQKNNHPAKNAIQTAVIVLQGQVSVLREKLAVLKANIISGCREATAAFKDKGVTALDSIARFFKVKSAFESIRDYLEKSISQDDKVIAKIEAISMEYHQAGLHIKNIGRAMYGKEAAQEAKNNGKLAAAISYPFRIERKCFAVIKRAQKPL